MGSTGNCPLVVHARQVGLTWSSTSPRQGARTGFPPARQSATQKHPSHWTNILGRMTPTCRTHSDTKAPLALGKSAREKTSLGSWEAPLALKNTSHLGQKDARDKRAREKHPSYWKEMLGGNDGQSAFCQGTAVSVTCLQRGVPGQIEAR